MKNKKLSNLEKILVVAVAKHYASGACPFFTYQPKMTKAVKNLKKK